MTKNAKPSSTPWVFSATIHGWGEGGDFRAQKLALSRLAERYAPAPYCREVEKFYIHFDVGGYLQDVKIEGPFGIRIYRPGKHIQVSVGIPACRWQQSAFGLALYIADCLVVGAEGIQQKLRDNKIGYDNSRLERDLERVMSRFLAWEWPAGVERASRRQDLFMQEARAVFDAARTRQSRRSR
jgi:hypothetical protein